MLALVLVFPSRIYSGSSVNLVSPIPPNPLLASLEGGSVISVLSDPPEADELDKIDVVSDELLLGELLEDDRLL